ncbi:hypothetical protein [Alloactinosynnema sp. L-07]|nr:hypothetical protein [Alloactinosynnema sp. L-07]CRK57026.1 hypothetical protein [Alloactinosynnema sp. L-07]
MLLNAVTDRLRTGADGVSELLDDLATSVEIAGSAVVQARA